MASININTLIAGFSAITISEPAPTPSQYLHFDPTNEGIPVALANEAAAPSAIVDQTSGFSSAELDAIIDAVSAFRITSVDPVLEAVLEIAAQLQGAGGEPMDVADAGAVVESEAMDLSEEVREVAMLTDAMEYREPRQVADWEI